MSKNSILLFRVFQGVYRLIIGDAELDDQPIEPGNSHPFGVQLFQQGSELLLTRKGIEHHMQLFTNQIEGCRAADELSCLWQTGATGFQPTSWRTSLLKLAQSGPSSCLSWPGNTKQRSQAERKKEVVSYST